MTKMKDTTFSEINKGLDEIIAEFRTRRQGGDKGLPVWNNMAEMQSSLHAEYSCLCSAEVKKDYGFSTQADLEGTGWELCAEFEKKYSKVCECLDEGFMDSIQFYVFEELDSRKISSTNTIKRLNKEIHRRSSVVGIFPSTNSYIRLITSCLLEYTENRPTEKAKETEMDDADPWLGCAMNQFAIVFGERVPLLWYLPFTHNSLHRLWNNSEVTICWTCSRLFYPIYRV